MKRIRKGIIIGVMTAAMAVSIFGCKGKEPAADDTSDTESEEQGQEEQQEEGEIQLTVYEESFHTAFSLAVGESRELQVNTDYDGTLKYKSGDETIATVDRKGNVTAVGAGIVEMTIIAGKVEKTVNVIVTEAESEEAREEDNTGDGTEEVAGNSGSAANHTANPPAAAENEPAYVEEEPATTTIHISTVILDENNENATEVYEQTVVVPADAEGNYYFQWQYTQE